ncbi:MAG TPA: type VI secretion system-associated protein TagF [Rhodopila sp.]|jgi:type VI secretion system protein ImpM
MQDFRCLALRAEMTAFCSFFGKIPARGDFVRGELPHDFPARWDAWIASVLPTALAAVGEHWLEAPVWRFGLAPSRNSSWHGCGLSPTARRP